MMQGHTLVENLQVPYVALRTLYARCSEVRLYQNDITGAHRVGKRVDLLSVDGDLAVNEAQALQDIDHPNVVKVLDVFAVSGFEPPMQVVEIIMPYHQRGSVFDAFDRGERFSLLEACDLAQKALLGLAHLHEVHRLLHRDVKSPNLFLVDDQSLLQVGDLGVASRIEADGMAPSFQGMHPYIAPETYTRGRIGPSADIYGLGLVLFELANHPLPYGEYSLEKLASRLELGRRGPRPRDLSFQPHVPRGLRRVITKAISIDPLDRFQTARQMNDALARVRLIDWRTIVETDDLVVWEGDCVVRRDRSYRVEARRRQRGRGWRLSGLQRVSDWRRAVDDIQVSQLGDAATAALFERLLSRALSA